MITLIAAIGRNNEIGYKGKMPWSIPEDMRHFKSYTMGKIIIMGSRTFLSLGKPLSGRRNVVVSSKNIPAGVCAHSIESALSIEHCYSELVVIGGESLYEQTIGRADKLVITHIDSNFEADTFFPSIDLTRWKINSTLDGSDEAYNYKFVEYIKG
jgi:dihydrofolate reductase